MKDAPNICPRCSTMCEPGEGNIRGNLLIEVLLYFAWILPGVIYSLWRRSGPPRCPQCDAEMISCETPAGARLMEGSISAEPRAPALTDE